MQKASPKFESTKIAKHSTESNMRQLTLQSFSYEARRKVLSALADAMARCGCWLLDRQVVSLTQTDFVFEVQHRAVLDLYTSLIGAGLELTRASHIALTDLCSVMKHGSRIGNKARVVHVVLEVSFLEELDLKSVLMPGAALA
jgi:hypothetical protein